MKKIKIFLASSNELISDREAFEREIYRKSKTWIDKGVSLHLEIWEDLSAAVSQSRSQDEYNKKIKEADIFVLLAYSKVGIYTAEEFAQAYELFKKNKKLRIFTYFKNSNTEIEGSLEEFKKELENLEHFYVSYSDFNHLWLQFNKELDSLLLEEFENFSPTQKEKAENKILISTENEIPNKMKNKEKKEEKGLLKPLLDVLDYFFGNMGSENKKKLNPLMILASTILIGYVVLIFAKLIQFNVLTLVMTFIVFPAILIVGTWVVAVKFTNQKTKNILGVSFIILVLIGVFAYFVLDKRQDIYNLIHEYQEQFPEKNEKKKEEKKTNPKIEKTKNETKKEEEKRPKKESEKKKKIIQNLHKVTLDGNLSLVSKVVFDTQEYVPDKNGILNLENVPDADEDGIVVEIYFKDTTKTSYTERINKRRTKVFFMQK